MQDKCFESYQGWEIILQYRPVRCSSFCFDIISPDGKKQHVAMAGDTRDRAMERAREMIDLERAFDEYHPSEKG